MSDKRGGQGRPRRDKLDRASRCLLALAAALILAAFALPLWRTTLRNVQYRDGLYVLIYLYKLGGDVEIVNTLGRAIGIRWMYWGIFPEMLLIPYATVGLAFWFLVLAAVGRRRWALVSAVLVVLGLGAGAGDAALRAYQVTHHLNPTAPITMEPFSIAPIGTSYFASYQVQNYPGGAAFLIAGAVAALVTAIWAPWRSLRRHGRASKWPWWGRRGRRT